MEKLDPEQQAILDELYNRVYPFISAIQFPETPDGLDQGEFRANLLISMAASLAATLILRAADEVAGPKRIKAVLASGAASLNGAFEMAKDEVLKSISGEDSGPDTRVH